jgi:hypothetical protein
VTLAFLQYSAGDDMYIYVIGSLDHFVKCIISVFCEHLPCVSSKDLLLVDFYHHIPLAKISNHRLMIINGGFSFVRFYAPSPLVEDLRDLRHIHVLDLDILGPQVLAIDRVYCQDF